MKAINNNEMKAILLDSPDSPKTLRVGEIEAPSPKPEEVLVKVAAAALNPVDYKLAAEGMDSWQYPFILGLDVAGIVEAVGEKVAQWQPGDRVFYHGSLLRNGAYAQYTTAPAYVMTAIPDGVDFIDAAAIPCAGFTAYQALHRKVGVEAKQTILIQGGSGGVGGFAVQIAKAAALNVIATCSQKNQDYVKSLGADWVIDYRHEDVPERVKSITKARGVDVILDTVSSQTATSGLDMLAFNGHLACVAGMPDYQKIKPFLKAPSIHAIALGGAYLSGDLPAQQNLARIGSELGQLVSQGKVDSMISETIALEDIPDALQRLAEGKIRGKVVVQIV